MAKLRERFVARSHVDRTGLTSAFAAGDRAELRRIAHSLSGAGGLFGFPIISALAAELEQAIDQGEHGCELQARLDALTSELERLRQW
jgi:HPt (histidine-containing phosphotransfer) domain-containing protein